MPSRIEVRQGLLCYTIEEFSKLLSSLPKYEDRMECWTTAETYHIIDLPNGTFQEQRISFTSEMGTAIIMLPNTLSIIIKNHNTATNNDNSRWLKAIVENKVKAVSKSKPKPKAQVKAQPAKPKTKPQSN